MREFPAEITYVVHETGRTARVSGMQDANMSPEGGARHFTLFVAVLTLFLSDFELIWTIRDFTINVGI